MDVQLDGTIYGDHGSSHKLLKAVEDLEDEAALRSGGKSMYYQRSPGRSLADANATAIDFPEAALRAQRRLRSTYRENEVIDVFQSGLLGRPLRFQVRATGEVLEYVPARPHPLLRTAADRTTPASYLQPGSTPQEQTFFCVAVSNRESIISIRSSLGPVYPLIDCFTSGPAKGSIVLYQPRRAQLHTNQQWLLCPVRQQNDYWTSSFRPNLPDVPSGAQEEGRPRRFVSLAEYESAGSDRWYCMVPLSHANSLMHAAEAVDGSLRLSPRDPNNARQHFRLLFNDGAQVSEDRYAAMVRAPTILSASLRQMLGFRGGLVSDRPASVREAEVSTSSSLKY